MEVTSNILEWNRQAVRYVDELGLAPQDVLPRQMSLLARTLVNVTPPRNRSKLRRRIQRDVESQFVALGGGDVRNFGKTGVVWYQTSPSEIYGSKRDATQLGVDELLSLYYTLEGEHHELLDIERRGKQTVYLTERPVAKRVTIRGVIRKLWDHIGRLKAGWLFGWRATGSQGSEPIPEWIAKHEAGARGYLKDGMSIPNHPILTIGNFAEGANEQTCGPWVDVALGIRARAISADLELYERGIKKP